VQQVRDLGRVAEREADVDRSIDAILRAARERRTWSVSCPVSATAASRVRRAAIIPFCDDPPVNDRDRGLPA
jgi:hypothetical protein